MHRVSGFCTLCTPDCARHVDQGIHLGERDASDDDAPLCAPSSSASSAAVDNDEDDAVAAAADNDLPDWLRGGMRTAGASATKKTPRKKSKR